MVSRMLQIVSTLPSYSTNTFVIMLYTLKAPFSSIYPIDFYIISSSSSPIQQVEVSQRNRIASTIPEDGMDGKTSIMFMKFKRQLCDQSQFKLILYFQTANLKNCGAIEFFFLPKVCRNPKVKLVKMMTSPRFERERLPRFYTIFARCSVF